MSWLGSKTHLTNWLFYAQLLYFRIKISEFPSLILPMTNLWLWASILLTKWLYFSFWFCPTMASHFLSQLGYLYVSLWFCRTTCRYFLPKWFFFDVQRYPLMRRLYFSVYFCTTMCKYFPNEVIVFERLVLPYEEQPISQRVDSISAHCSTLRRAYIFFYQIDRISTLHSVLRCAAIFLAVWLRVSVWFCPTMCPAISVTK